MKADDASVNDLARCGICSGGRAGAVFGRSGAEVGLSRSANDGAAGGRAGIEGIEGMGSTSRPVKNVSTGKIFTVLRLDLPVMVGTIDCAVVGLLLM
jgi:hypothetical protein